MNFSEMTFEGITEYFSKKINELASTFNVDTRVGGMNTILEFIRKQDKGVDIGFSNPYRRPLKIEFNIEDTEIELTYEVISTKVKGVMKYKLKNLHCDVEMRRKTPQIIGPFIIKDGLISRFEFENVNTATNSMLKDVISKELDIEKEYKNYCTSNFWKRIDHQNKNLISGLLGVDWTWFDIRDKNQVIKAMDDLIVIDSSTEILSYKFELTEQLKEAYLSYWDFLFLDEKLTTDEEYVYCSGNLVRDLSHQEFVFKLKRKDFKKPPTSIQISEYRDYGTLEIRDK